MTYGGAGLGISALLTRLLMGRGLRGGSSEALRFEERVVATILTSGLI
jgi:hypothetical protein